MLLPSGEMLHVPPFRRSMTSTVPSRTSMLTSASAWLASKCRESRSHPTGFPRATTCSPLPLGSTLKMARTPRDGDHQIRGGGRLIVVVATHASGGDKGDPAAAPPGGSQFRGDRLEIVHVHSLGEAGELWRLEAARSQLLHRGRPRRPTAARTIP